ncbi:hypothetical protein JOC34_000565 [Virgibacillus halotolerans]|nr:hypothetical protein [Virgibacillus halotolerans]
MENCLEQLLEEISVRKSSHMEWCDESYGNSNEQRLIRIKIKELEDIRDIVIDYCHKEREK